MGIPHIFSHLIFQVQNPFKEGSPYSSPHLVSGGGGGDAAWW